MERGVTRNWAQRYLIWHELNKRQTESPKPKGGILVDPLASVKEHYYWRFCDELGKLGNLRVQDVPHPLSI